MVLGARDVAGIAEAMAAGVSFETRGELSGRPGGVSMFGVGHLDAYWRDLVAVAGYVVFSYGTPIAWRDGRGQWVRPLDKYSVTTTRHQTTVDAAIERIAPVVVVGGLLSGRARVCAAV